VQVVGQFLTATSSGAVQLKARSGQSRGQTPTIFRNPRAAREITKLWYSLAQVAEAEHGDVIALVGSVGKYLYFAEYGLADALGIGLH